MSMKRKYKKNAFYQNPTSKKISYFKRRGLKVQRIDVTAIIIASYLIILKIYLWLSAFFNKLYFTTSFIFILIFSSENSDTGTQQGSAQEKIWSEPGTHRNPLFGFRLGTRNPLEPTFWVPTRNPEPTATHFLGSDSEPGTHWTHFFGSDQGPGTHWNPF